MNQQSTDPVPTPVGVCAFAAPMGWAWLAKFDSGEIGGTFDGPIDQLADHIQKRLFELTAHPVATFIGFTSKIRQANIRERDARIAADREIQDESKGLAKEARAQLRIEHPILFPNNIDRPENPPFSFDERDLGRIACDASVNPGGDEGAWAVTSESGWYQSGKIYTDPGMLNTSSAELIALQRATLFAESLPGEIQIFNDNKLAIEVSSMLQKGVPKRAIIPKFEHLAHSAIDSIGNRIKFHFAHRTLRFTWHPRNSTPAMKWADEIARFTNTGEMKPTVHPTNLQGAPSLQDKLPKIVLNFISRAESHNWKVVESSTIQPTQSSNFRRKVKIERSGIHMTFIFRKIRKQWKAGEIYDHHGIKKLSFDWNRIDDELA